MSSIGITATSTIVASPAPSAPATGSTLALRSTSPIRGAGGTLREGARPIPVLCLRNAEEIEMRSKTPDATTAIGDCSAQLDQLIVQMRGECPTELQKDIDQWIEEFRQLQTIKEQAHALGILVVRDIEPFLVSPENKDIPVPVQDRLLGWIESTKKILEQILPAEYPSVDTLLDTLLETCADGMHEETMLRNLAAHVDRTTLTNRATLNFVAKKAYSDIERTFYSLQQKLLSLQEFKKTAHQCSEAAIESVSQELREVSEELQRRAVALDTLGVEMMAQQAIFHKSLDECRLILKGVLS